jgi:hypothetical protein
MAITVRPVRDAGDYAAWRQARIAVVPWAAEHGMGEVYTWTQRGNDDMRALNEHLGFVTRRESLSMRASLPLTGLPSAG